MTSTRKTYSGNEEWRALSGRAPERPCLLTRFDIRVRRATAQLMGGTPRADVLREHGRLVFEAADCRRITFLLERPRCTTTATAN